jgi:hypothetical protein
MACAVLWRGSLLKEEERDMSNITEVAKKFFEACETGKGWEECKAYLHAQCELLGTSRATG